ncbi:LOW QUALITY PROTEIN: arrestin domain-containing protein 3-like [Ammospiza nelsoni]|uniref:LOW QUALITY PROTEIN: arrestin domain-containing protein 3-like n=1 Tax=Ammospiza nelsoni TaxID=2857394 RepID=UPI00286C5654|nr:LOW QUALITY PROTEIN: arrestin domain-containing protein 3-like [Ammospiza nelsoni]
MTACQPDQHVPYERFIGIAEKTTTAAQHYDIRTKAAGPHAASNGQHMLLREVQDWSVYTGQASSMALWYEESGWLSGTADLTGSEEGMKKYDDNSEEGLHIIHSGRHEYAFSFELPQIPLATSFEGRHGSVRYWVKAELHRPWLLPVKLKKEFTVFEHIDINTPSLLSPQAGTKEKTLCCWLCTSGPISLSVKIERKGYTPGESIQIFAEIENCSSRMVVPKATIYQTQAFYAKGKMKEVRQLVANLRGESLSSGKTETWNGKQLKIPPVCPSILDCSIIHVEYSLMVYVDIPGAVDLFLNLPLVIGTIPLHPFGSRTSSVSSQGSMSMNWLGLTLPERLEAPPNYAEVVTEENRQSGLAPVAAFDDFQRALQGPLFAYIQEFRFLPPPLYSEIDPNPHQPTDEILSCPSR